MFRPPPRDVIDALLTTICTERAAQGWDLPETLHLVTTTDLGVVPSQPDHSAIALETHAFPVPLETLDAELLYEKLSELCVRVFRAHVVGSAPPISGNVIGLLLLSEAWMVEVQGDEFDREDMPAPSQHERRVEVLMATFASMAEPGVSSAMLRRGTDVPSLLHTADQTEEDRVATMSGRLIRPLIMLAMLCGPHGAEWAREAQAQAQEDAG